MCRYEIICDPCSPVVQNRRSDVNAEQLVKLSGREMNMIMGREKKTNLTRPGAESLHIAGSPD